MYIITQSQWDKIPNDYKAEHSQTHGGRAVFAGCIEPNGGTTLIFEGLHFAVLPKEYESGDTEKDTLTCHILEELADMTPEQREEWRANCTARYNDRADKSDAAAFMDYLPLAVKVAGDFAELEKILS